VSAFKHLEIVVVDLIGSITTEKLRPDTCML